MRSKSVLQIKTKNNKNTGFGDLMECFVIHLKKKET